jgi:hypothetical protein
MPLQNQLAIIMRSLARNPNDVNLKPASVAGASCKNLDLNAPGRFPDLAGIDKVFPMQKPTTS